MVNETGSYNSYETANYHPFFLADVTVEDVETACKKGMFDFKAQENRDGSRMVLLIGTGEFRNCIYYRLNVCPEGRVYFDILFYRSIVKNKKNIPLMIAQFENTVKLWLKADI